MMLKRLPNYLTVCKVRTMEEIDLAAEFCFIARTDEEISLVCNTADTPENAIAREDGWRAFRVEGILDFSMVGVLSKMSTILAENGIGLFAVSTYNTDYILVKAEDFDRSLALLEQAGYTLGTA